MAGPLPHSKAIQAQSDEFLKDAITEFTHAASTLGSSHAFRQIFKTSLAGSCALDQLLKGNQRPHPNAAIGTTTLIPLLVCARQLGSARIELRRLIELCAWDIYFRDHSVEWNCFITEPTKGFTRDLDNPIDYCAHRELSFYLSYARARVAAEPSGIALAAVDEIRMLLGALNSAVHPGATVATIGAAIPLDPIDEGSLSTFGGVHRSVLKNLCLLVAAVNTPRFNLLPPMYRAHFDWLVGAKLDKAIRSGPFGL